MRGVSRPEQNPPKNKSLTDGKEVGRSDAGFLRYFDFVRRTITPRYFRGTCHLASFIGFDLSASRLGTAIMRSLPLLSRTCQYLCKSAAECYKPRVNRSMIQSSCQKHVFGRADDGASRITLTHRS